MQSHCEESQEIRHVFLEILCFLSLALNCVEDLKVLLQLLRHVQNGSHIAAAIAVVWRAPNCHQRRVFKPVLEAVHY